MKRIDTVYTRRFKDIACGVIENRTMALITGPAGVGKTTAARMYAESGETRCYSVTAHNLMRPGDYLNALLDTMVQFRGWSIAERFEQVVKGYEYRAGLTVIDEADLLRVEVLELIRSLHDCSGAPVVLVGSKRFPGILRKRGLDQLTSRLQFQAVFAPMDLTELRLALPDVDAEAVKLIHKASRGNMRTLTMLMRNIDRIKQVNGLSDTTPEVIRAAAEDVIVI